MSCLWHVRHSIRNRLLRWTGPCYKSCLLFCHPGRICATLALPDPKFSPLVTDRSFGIGIPHSLEAVPAFVNVICRNLGERMASAADRRVLWSYKFRVMPHYSMLIRLSEWWRSETPLCQAPKQLTLRVAMRDDCLRRLSPIGPQRARTLTRKICAWRRKMPTTTLKQTAVGLAKGQAFCSLDKLSMCSSDSYKYDLDPFVIMKQDHRTC